MWRRCAAPHIRRYTLRSMADMAQLEHNSAGGCAAVSALSVDTYHPLGVEVGVGELMPGHGADRGCGPDWGSPI